MGKGRRIYLGREEIKNLVSCLPRLMDLKNIRNTVKIVVRCAEGYKPLEKIRDEYWRHLSFPGFGILTDPVIKNVGGLTSELTIFLPEDLKKATEVARAVLELVNELRPELLKEDLLKKYP